MTIRMVTDAEREIAESKSATPIPAVNVCALGTLASLAVGLVHLLMYPFA